MAEGLDEDPAPWSQLAVCWGCVAPGASLLAWAACKGRSEGWVVGMPWKQCQKGAVGRPGPPTEALEP